MPTFRGTVLSIGELVARAQAAPEPDWQALYGHVGLRNDAADAAAICIDLVRDGESLAASWRFGVLQAVDYYDSCVRRGGTDLGAQVFDREPPRTGANEIDAAFAALAEYLAERDGWAPPAWVDDPSRVSSKPWYLSDAPWFRAEADRVTPPAFRSRGVFIGVNDLDRA